MKDTKINNYKKGLKKEQKFLNKIFFSFVYFYKYFFKSPTRIIVSGFVIFILIGAGILSSPLSNKDGNSLNFLDALFTATSAVCVTGLTIYNTGSQFTIVGQVTIMFLIQLGGLGFMTVTSFLFLLLGKKFTLQQRLIIKESYDETNIKGIVRLINKILIYTISIETITAILLFPFFYNATYDFNKSALMSVFHSVSSFCNAGFDLMSMLPKGIKSPSLTQYYDNAMLIVPISINIILGGIGFSTMSDVLRLRKKHHKLSTHSKIVIISTFTIITLGTILIFTFERMKTMKNFNTGYKFLNSYFQIVTSRTAGFNTIPQNEMTIPTKLITLISMFVGASPGSTGGGVKTTSFTLFLLIAVTTILGKKDINIFKRKLDVQVIRKTISIIAFALITIFLTTFIVSIIEKDNKNTTLESLLFETTSAFTTTGLSYGITSTLKQSSRFFIGLAMFIGRSGTLTLGTALVLNSINPISKNSLKYPDIKIRLG